MPQHEENFAIASSHPVTCAEYGAADRGGHLRLVRLFLFGGWLEPEHQVRRGTSDGPATYAEHRPIPREHRRQGIQGWSLLLRQSARAAVAGGAGSRGYPITAADSWQRSVFGAGVGAHVLCLQFVLGRAADGFVLCVFVPHCAATWRKHGCGRLWSDRCRPWHAAL